MDLSATIVAAAGPFGLSEGMDVYRDATNAIGVIGALLYLTAFGAIQLGVLRGEGYAYSTINFFASGFVLISLATDYNFASFLVNAAWLTLSVIGLVRLFLLSRRLSFDDAEARFLAEKLPALERRHARRLLDIANWFDAEPGHIFIHEDAPVQHLIYLESGDAEVTYHGRRLGSAAGGAMIGEITCLTREAATATVTAKTAARYMAIDAVALRRLVDGAPDLRQALQASFMAEAKMKIARMNAEKASSIPA
ncbi:MAG: cyclic nucleotide-binding domain-containing protein [Pseudomonadota bacterium]